MVELISYCDNMSVTVTEQLPAEELLNHKEATSDDEAEIESVPLLQHEAHVTFLYEEQNKEEKEIAIS